jgi:acyl carrier protein
MLYLEKIKKILISSLFLEKNIFDQSDSTTLLLGSIPELDSIGVIAVITALEEEFVIHIEYDDISGDTFDSLATLSHFIETKKET